MFSDEKIDSWMTWISLGFAVVVLMAAVVFIDIAEPRATKFALITLFAAIASGLLALAGANKMELFTGTLA